jgi:uncharacterized protein (TIGR03437 family)
MHLRALVLIAFALASVPVEAFAQGNAHFRREGTQILRDGVPYRAIGANKFDLGIQFTGNGNYDQSRALSVDLAIQALDDGYDRGLPFLRFSLLGFTGADVQKWQNDPGAFRRRLGELCDRAAERQVLLVPDICWRVAMLGDVTGERLGSLIGDPSSHGFAILMSFVSDVVTYLAGRDEILMWELTNEINLDADISHYPSFGLPEDDFTTADLTGWVTRYAGAIRAIDPVRPITTGFGSPRSWDTARTAQDLVPILRATHPDPVDVICFHPYDAEVGKLALYKEACDIIGKPMFAGEFGVTHPDLNMDRVNATPAYLQYVANLESSGVALAAVWDYDLFDSASVADADPDNLFPDVDEGIFAAMRAVNERSGAIAPGRPSTGVARVTLAAPLEGATLAPGQVTMVNARASDPVSIDHVDVLVDGTLVTTMTVFPYQTTWTPSTPGPHSIVAVVTGASGTTRSRPVHVTVTGAPAAGTVTVANYSSRWNEVAPLSLAVASGQGLALNAATVSLQDARGAVFTASVIFASPSSVYFIVPSAAPGAAQVTVSGDSGAVSTGGCEVVPIAPGISSLDGSGSGVAAANVVSFHSDGTVSSADASQPIDLAGGDRVYLYLYGTGATGGASSIAPGSVKVSIGEVPVVAEWAGPQGASGVDQVNVLLPASLAGRGTVDLVVEVAGARANTVQVTFK